jgi:hypothetical protein
MKARLAAPAMAAMLAVGLWSQQPAGGSGKRLGDREKCPEGQSCECGSPPINVPAKCECRIDSVSGTGTSHCPIGDIGIKPLTWTVAGGVIGGVIGAALTLLLTRNRRSSQA